MVLFSLQLDIDDSEKVRTRIEGRARLSTRDSPQYFGGVPDDYTVFVTNVGGSRTRFIGCISDVVINDKYVMLLLLFIVIISTILEC